MELLLAMIGCMFVGGGSGASVAFTQREPAAKIAHRPENARAGVLIVKFCASAEPAMRATAARSGLPAFDAVLDSIGAVRLHRVFPVNHRTEKRTRESGLHLWYTVGFDGDADLETTALRLARVSEVEVVEYDVALQPASALP